MNKTYSYNLNNIFIPAVFKGKTKFSGMLRITIYPTLFFCLSLICAMQARAQNTPDSLRVKLTKARSALSQVNAAGKKLGEPKKVRERLNAIGRALPPIASTIHTQKKEISEETLLQYNKLLKSSQEQLGAYRKGLSRSVTDLRSGKNILDKLNRDSLLAVSKTDSAARPLDAAQISRVRSQLRNADQYISINLDTVTRLLSDVSSTYLQIADLQSDIAERQKAGSNSKFKQEATYLWSAPKETSKTNIADNISSTYQGQNQVFNDFLNSTWDDRLLAILLGALFFLWVSINYKKAKNPEQKVKIGELKFYHITPLPITGAIIVMLVLSPLCQPDAPFQYMEVIHLLLLLALSVFFWHRLQKNELRYWLFTVMLFVIIELTTAAVHESLILRSWFILLNLSSIYFGFVFSRKLLKTEVTPKLIRPVLFIYITLNVLAVVTNVFGRMSLAKSFTGTAIIGLTEVIGLSVFIQLMTDALELQIKLSACSGGLFSRLDVSSARMSFKRLLAGVGIIIWLLVFMINLGISKTVWSFLSQLLDNKRSFGSISFTIGNVLFFALILYISNLFQKHIGVLFGEKSVTFNNEVEHKSSKLTLFRLIVAIVGVLLAVTASGIPLDKLTVVLGALSVGIGLGMQNIVNNFVSGIILIFEKPFQIGDFVELADKKGKIQDIGIRASKMLTQQGSEVVIPNGDLISNRFTNWTINSAYVQSEILIKVSISADLAKAEQIISEEISASETTVKDNEPLILINSIGGDAVELRALVWISSIYVEPAFKSNLFSKLITRFNTEQIKIM